MTPNKNGFDYSALDKETLDLIQACTVEIQSRLISAVEQMIEIGQQLQIAKERLKHGQFQEWLRSEFNMNPRQARRLMLVAKQFKTDKYAVLKFAPSALYLLAETKTPNTARKEALTRAQKGENISWSNAKEIVARHKGIAGNTPDMTNDSAAASKPKTKVKKQPETLKPSCIQPSRSDKTPLVSAMDLGCEEEDSQRAENAIIDIPAITIPDEIPQVTSSDISASNISVGDRVRILRRQEGEDKWTGCIAQIWEITPSGWLRVNVEGHQGVKFTLKPEWVELLETFMPDDINQRTRASDRLQRKVRIPVEVGGQTIEIEGIAKSVEVEWEHDGQRGVAFVPFDEVIISTKE